MCPAAGHKSSEIDPENPELKVVDYEYVKGLKLTDPSDLVLAYDREPWHEGKRYVLFIEGYVEPMEEGMFRLAIGKTKRYLEEKGRLPD